MLAEKSHTAQTLIDKISSTAGKVDFISDAVLSRALMYLETNGIPNNRHEDYKYCNLDAVLKREFRDIGQRFGDIKDVTGYKLDDTITLVVVNGNYSERLSD